MIEIKKFSNVYGIKELIHPELIKENTIIYAPNGVMKTSFSDGLKDIINGNIPKDVFCNPPKNASFEIIDNGKAITENNNLQIEALVFDFNDGININTLENENLFQLVLSQELKKKYEKLFNDFISKKNKILNLIIKNVVEKKDRINDLYELFHSDQKIEDFICSLPDLNSYNESFYKEIEYSTLFNDKTLKILNDSDFKNKILEYNKYIDKQFDERIFSHGLSLDGLISIKEELIDKKYFEAGHKLLINNKEVDSSELEKIISETITNIYGTPEEKRLFAEATVLLGKNKSAKEFTEYVSKNKRCLKELEDINEFKKKIVFSKLNTFAKEVDDFKNEISSFKAELKKISNEAKDHLKTWQRVLNDYNSRFISNKLDLIIENTTESVLGQELPRFKKTIKGTDIEIDDEILNRFSSGEKRAILILNLLFEIELRKGKKFVLVLDDIADSFDYKNKYAIIESLKDISQNKDIQLIILTHNFDFYRSVRIALGNNIQSKLIASANNNIVTLYDAKTKDYDDYRYFNNWKNDEKEISLIAILPFLRNIKQLMDNSKNSDYILLTQFLHYNLDLETKNINELDAIFNSSNVKHSNMSFIYLNELKKQVGAICNNNLLKETSLKEKIVLGIFIRVFTDRFMFQRYQKNAGANPSLGGENQSNELFKEVQQFLNIDEERILKTAFTIAPSFIHINSFMYEPLVDVGIEKLVEVAKSIESLQA